MTTPLTHHNLLPDLGPPESLSHSPPFTDNCNAHIHLPPNFSAFDTVQQAVDLAAAEHIAALGVSNYYDYAVYTDFARRAAAAGIFPLFGIEILTMQEGLRAAGIKVNDPGNPGKTYLCGKGICNFTPDSITPEAQRLLTQIRKSDSRRMADMIGKLAQVLAQRGLATGLDHEAVVDMVVRRHGSPRDTVYLQERHAAQAFQEAIFRKIPAAERIEKLSVLLGAATKATSPDDHVAVQNDIRSHLMKAGKPAFVEDAFVSFDDAVTLVRELGGFPAYPVLADGTSPICGFESTPETLIANLQTRNMCAAEFIPVRNDPDVLSRYVKALRGAGMVVTAGTEHNTLDLIPIRPTCVKGAAIPPDIQAIFREGACVVAAHQYLSMHGRKGYTGRDNAQIARLAQLGAAVLHAYCQKTGVAPGVSP